MPPDSTEDPRSEAIDQLEHLGLSTYAARTFVALVELEFGTAQDVSEVADVPRTRVYDAVDELHGRGLVDVQQSSPKEFYAISADTAGRKFDREFRERTTTLTTALDQLEPRDRTEEVRGVWTVDGNQSVTDRVVDFLGDAEEEIVYMTVEELLTDEIVAALRDASDRDVTIRLAGLSPTVQERIRDSVPEAEPFESLWLWSDTPAGRLMMVDGRKTLVSVRTNGDDEPPDAPRSETAIWGAGDANGLVVVLRTIFTWRLADSPGS
ncbi:TrmB family transcriptional regulator [Haloglomus litoreum]|uniref:TrmB family transcriptional regulator n=1 Tax=Haloglomus litoreum TaxID=3034026 RepID=UPI0023E78B46|nr:helix-turn-helix domain-containing protein [Haloglomus sp. DT116]